jgi:Mg/Co/Ni transporter MgtE
MTSEQDIQQIALLWGSLTNGQRSRRLQRMTEEQKQQLKLALRYPEKTPGSTPSLLLPD